MGKIKVAICIGESEYQERFVKCLMNHYKERYELHIFEEPKELKELESRPYAGYILGEEVYETLEIWDEDMPNVLVLNEENKYREVYKLMEEFELLLGDYMAEISCVAGTKCRVVGVYSLAQPHTQMPFAAMLAGICAEQNKTILLDFQAYSGLAEAGKEDSKELGMEDVMAMSVTGSYNKSCLLSAIGRHRQWDYIYPVKNVRCLQEMNVEMMVSMISLFTKESEYQTIILNLGEGSATMHELADVLDTCYLLCPKGDSGGWREKSYIEEMERRGKDDFLHRITRIEVPAVFGADVEWDRVSEQWKWSAVGDVLRKLIREETYLGQTV